MIRIERFALPCGISAGKEKVNGRIVFEIDSTRVVACLVSNVLSPRN